MDAHLEQLFDFLRFPSISTDPACRDDVSACGEWLYKKFQSMGLDAAVHGTPGHPVIFARNAPKPGRPTVLIYGHYDVQPADPLDLWTSPPFEPRLENGIITARGSADNKGQIMAHILGVEQALAGGGELPVNVLFVVEGEEEIGSPNLAAFLTAHAEELRCDVVVISDTTMVAPGVPTLTYGLRGIGCLELRVTGPAIDLHSGIYGGAVQNPITALARLLATLHDSQGRIAVAGLCDKVLPLQDWERKAWAGLSLDDARLLEITGAPELFGEAGYKPLERMWARPTVEINGIGGGYQGEGTKTVIPSKAFAKLTFRLVPDQSGTESIRLVSEHLKRHVPPGVKIEITDGHHGDPYLTDPHSDFGKAAQRALAATFGRQPALIREGGSIPIVSSFKEILGVDTLLLGLALPDCRAHSPNETFTVENFEAGIRLNQALLREIAAGKV
ncbi:MAG TPA: dipeptidase [Chthoniobacteraceae bacterium]|jgi:acetylornithine deacetylase/succinyl-diaminopimelate desuccinylase-like protein|nr:dipeptidase [Chthoniobacteraceae bacterium]